MGLTDRNKIDSKLAQAIQADMATLDKAPSKADITLLQPCDCSGGPGKTRTPEVRGTGLLDDYTLCPKCQGEGTISVAQG